MVVILLAVVVIVIAVVVIVIAVVVIVVVIRRTKHLERHWSIDNRYKYTRAHQWLDRGEP